MIQVLIGRGSGPTGRRLVELLRERGLEVNSGGRATAIVSYGVPVRSTSLPSLNGAAGHLNKFEQLVKMREVGLQVPNYQSWDPSRVFGWRLSFPVFGRLFHHSQGRDIVLARGSRELSLAPPRDYYVEYIRPAREYRVWAYRRKPIGVYEKTLAYPARLARRVRRLRLAPEERVWNWRNGYAYNFYAEAPEDLRNLGAQAVEALGLDFGAADILEGQDGRRYVLEVNTAPGTEGPRQGLVNLVTKITKWHTLGYPARKGTKDADKD